MKETLAGLIQPLQHYVGGLLDEPATARMSQLQQTAEFISERLAAGRRAKLIFVCTHNSRRSHLAHVWADTGAYLYGLAAVDCYSGGVEVTSCNERTVRALRRAGFSVVKSTDTDNPVYLVQYAESRAPIACTSKIYSTNAYVSDFAAMMCCADVEASCPVVDGASIRVPLHYDDPKEADNTPDEEDRYDERCRQIGRDMLIMMSMVQG